MTQREKVLAGAVAAAGVLWFGVGGLERYRTAVTRNENLATQAASALDDAEFAVQRGERAKRRLIEWGRRSLPTDRDVAKSLYQDWIRTQLTGAGLTIEQLTDRTLNRQAPHYGELSLEGRVSGTLEQLTDFLYKFYAAPHLHRISAATLTPSENGAKLATILTIDALILPDSDRRAQLAEGEGEKLPKSLEELRTSLAGRNVFAPHTPGAKSDEGGNGAKFTAIMSDGPGYQVWITTDEPAKTHKFRIGDEMAFGKVKGKLVEIDYDARRAIVETAEGRMELLLDQPLSEATRS